MSKTSIQADLKGRIAKGLNFGIEAVEEVLSSDSPIYNDFVLLKSKYNDLMYLSSLNTLPYEQIEIGMDRLRNTLLAIIDRMDESSIGKEEIDPDLKIQALPARRSNFFKLLDIHFKNLEAIEYVEVYAEQESKEVGREAIFRFYNMHRRTLQHQEKLNGPEGPDVLRDYFFKYFQNETGEMEVYFKNIKHLLRYALASEIERQFFLDTIKSLFSKFELATIHYYAMSRIDPEFSQLVEKSELLNEDGFKKVLIAKGPPPY
ncbi:putative phage abortive infection protein [Flavilitoribacter nigricans]|uniref:Effector-associated domain-containing protein n=1 Tax=Flavilitoribacter nigricans (strain ATCC 23147 / DSM 23189 / NBRC 102662 / NCIMB 1420 / SS-2) TaxID=1122177 RepID=A0A2D0N6W9_FLAN2|nr:putative phage abortive infection protein [Flavilitoribacter nigricans]PHN04261.1 hypothetical protein CRP01_22120 [Flavilitoribacter nigricans DSM 23189 = NBRC 102662]